jgi:hypothetical protein
MIIDISIKSKFYVECDILTTCFVCLAAIGEIGCCALPPGPSRKERSPLEYYGEAGPTRRLKLGCHSSVVAAGPSWTIGTVSLR